MVRGFTLLEVLATVAIIGILAAISVGPLQAARQRSRDTQRKADIEVLAQALDLYYAEQRDYPGDDDACFFSSDNVVNDNKSEPWIPGLSDRYVTVSRGTGLPRDPFFGKNDAYHYEYFSGECLRREAPGLNAQVLLRAQLENKQDSDVDRLNGTYTVTR